jgi:hypothetical protein
MDSASLSTHRNQYVISAPFFGCAKCFRKFLHYVKRLTYGLLAITYFLHTTTRCQFQTGDTTMFTKSSIALAIILAITSGAFAATKKRQSDPNAALNSYAAAATKQRQHSSNPSWDVYDVSGRYLGSDPDIHVRQQMQRDSVNE